MSGPVEDLSGILQSIANLARLAKHDKYSELKAIRQEINKKEMIISLESEMAREFRNANLADLASEHEERVKILTKEKEEKLELYKKVSETN